MDNNPLELSKLFQSKLVLLVEIRKILIANMDSVIPINPNGSYSYRDVATALKLEWVPIVEEVVRDTIDTKTTAAKPLPSVLLVAALYKEVTRQIDSLTKSMKIEGRKTIDKFTAEFETPFIPSPMSSVDVRNRGLR